MIPDFRLCDVCGSKVEFTRSLEFDTDRHQVCPASGKSEIVCREADLCHKCCYELIKHLTARHGVEDWQTVSQAAAAWHAAKCCEKSISGK